MGDCIFCKIANGEVPCAKLYEDPKVLVFLDAFPSVEGQSLVISKKHYSSYFAKLPDSVFSELLLVAKKVAKHVDSVYKNTRTCLIIEGFQVDHVHIKLYPVVIGKPLDTTSGGKASSEELKRVAERVKL